MSANISSVEGDENLCRVCMVSGSKRKTLLSIFDKLPNDKTTFVEAFTALELGGQPQDITNDDFTKKVCKKCTEEVQKVYNSVTNLRQKCQETHLKLTEIANCQKIEAVDVIIKEEGHDEYVEEISPIELIDVIFKIEKTDDKKLVFDTEPQVSDEGDGGPSFSEDCQIVTYTKAKLSAPKKPKKNKDPDFYVAPPQKKHLRPRKPRPIKTSPRGSYQAKMLLKFCCKCTQTFQTEEQLLDHFNFYHFDKIRTDVDPAPGDEKKIQCILCKAMVTDYRKHSRRSHYVKHLERQNKCLCRFCGKVFMTYSGRSMCEQRHKNELNNITFGCKLCEKSYTTRASLYSHKKTHEEKSKFACELCGELLNSLARLEFHLMKHSRIYTCDVCKKLFKRKDEMQVHLLRHFSRRDHQCEMCEKAFICATECVSVILDGVVWDVGDQYLRLPAEILNVVVKKETPEEEVLVKKKNARAKSSARKTTLRTPESSSLPPEPIKPKIRRMRNSKLNFCCKCKETFVHEKDLNAHFQIAHANKIKEFQIDELPPDSNKSACTLCKMMVVRMQQHRRQKHYTIQKRAPSKLNLCKYCGKVYISYAGVYICEKRHESEVDKQTFQCPKCPKTFPMIQRLRKHMKFHSEKFPFTCEVCGRKYRDSSKLKLHQIKHSDEKKYKCDICQKEMKHQSTLRFHMKVHTGVMDHHCEYCSKSFYRTTELKRHRAIHMKHMARASAQLNDFQPTP